MRKSCLVIGYMNNNLGDDLFFDILFKRYPKVDFYMYPPSVLLDNYKKIYSKYKNVIFYDEEEYYKKQREDIIDKNTPINLFPMICERAKKVDFYINIGGSIFIQNDNWKNDDRFKLKKLIGDKPSFIIGCNFGPGDQEYYQFYYEWFKEFDDICFRDSKSFYKFKKLENVRLADDIVLIKKEKNTNSLFKCFYYNKSIAISIIDIATNKTLKNYEKDYYNFMINTINYYIENKYKVTLFSFCKQDGDLDAINKLISKLSDKNRGKLKVVNYKDNINKFLRQWKKNKYVIGTRFHSLILALAYDQEFLALSYSKKTNNYLSSIDKNIKVVDISTIGKRKIEKLTFSKINKEYNSEIQFLKIDEYISKE